MVSKFNLVFTSSDVSPNIFYHKKKINKYKDIKLINDYNKILCMYEMELLISQTDQYEYTDEFCPSRVIRQLFYETYEFLIDMYEDELQSVLRDNKIIKKYLDKFKLEGEKCDECRKIKDLKQIRISKSVCKNVCDECYKEYEKLINNPLFGFNNPLYVNN